MQFESIDEIRSYFEGDQFATKCLGAHVDEWEPGNAVVSMTVDERHHNAQGFVMGGVIFSLADFALAVASNADRPDGCSVDHSISFMGRIKGERIIATARELKNGRTLSFYEVDICDELGNHAASMSATCFHV